MRWRARGGRPCRSETKLSLGLPCHPGTCCRDPAQGGHRSKWLAGCRGASPGMTEKESTRYCATTVSSSRVGAAGDRLTPGRDLPSRRRAGAVGEVAGCRWRIPQPCVGLCHGDVGGGRGGDVGESGRAVPRCLLRRRRVTGDTRESWAWAVERRCAADLCAGSGGCRTFSLCGGVRKVGQGIGFRDDGWVDWLARLIACGGRRR
jgi:hypothetical protein